MIYTYTKERGDHVCAHADLIPVASHCHTTRPQCPHLPLHREEAGTYLRILGDIRGKDQACSPQGLSLWHGPALNLLLEAAAHPQTSSDSALHPHQ